MKTLRLIAVAVMCAVFAAGVAAQAKPTGANNLQHFVAFKFKATATPEQIQQVVDALRALEKKIPQIDKFRWGKNVSPEKLDKGFTHCFKITFKDEKDRDTYLNHPDHKAFGAVLKPVMEDVIVLDYWSQE
jgi:hypothetical protein